MQESHNNTALTIISATNGHSLCSLTVTNQVDKYKETTSFNKNENAINSKV